MFNAQVSPLAQDYRLLAWDARGHGKSQPAGFRGLMIEDYADDLIALLDHVGIDRAVLAGQSMGAYIAQHVARLHPQRLQGLVVIGSTPIAFPVSLVEVASLKFFVWLFGLWPYQSLVNMMAQNTTIKADVKRYALDAIGQMDHKTLLNIWRAVSTAVRREGYPDFRIEVPFMLTHGDNDVTGTIRRDGPRWAKSDPSIRYEVIPNAGHNANQDNPEVFNRLLGDFLAALDLSA